MHYPYWHFFCLVLFLSIHIPDFWKGSSIATGISNSAVGHHSIMRDRLRISSSQEGFAWSRITSPASPVGGTPLSPTVIDWINSRPQCSSLVWKVGKSDATLVTTSSHKLSIAFCQVCLCAFQWRVDGTCVAFQ